MCASLALPKGHLRNIFEQESIIIRLAFQKDPAGGPGEEARPRLQPEVRMLFALTLVQGRDEEGRGGRRDAFTSRNTLRGETATFVKSNQSGQQFHQ